jgi:3-oxoacyl-[acyl-carrier-protein] synthase II
LEERASAEARGATIYAEVLAGTSSSVAGRDRVAQRDLAMKNALEMALKSANVRPEDVGFVNAHGLSTRTADVEEARAINQVFGSRARPVPVVAPKSHFGNLGAGSGMVELIAGVLALGRGRLFPVLNYQLPDPDCPVSVVTGAEDQGPGRSFAKLSVTPQGQASAALLGRWEG